MLKNFLHELSCFASSKLKKKLSRDGSERSQRSVSQHFVQKQGLLTWCPISVWGGTNEKQGLYGTTKEPAEDSSQLCHECKCLLHILGGVVRHGEGSLPLLRFRE